MGNEKQSSLVEGPVFGSLIRFAGPVLGALILQAAYGAVDLMVVGRFGDASSISAVGTGSTFMQMITCVIICLAMGATVTIGQHIVSVFLSPSLRQGLRGLPWCWLGLQRPSPRYTELFSFCSALRGSDIRKSGPCSAFELLLNACRKREKYML